MLGGYHRTSAFGFICSGGFGWGAIDANFGRSACGIVLVRGRICDFFGCGSWNGLRTCGVGIRLFDLICLIEPLILLSFVEILLDDVDLAEAIHFKLLEIFKFHVD